MGGNEWGQGEKAREHGADVLSCADNPSGEACQRGIAENKAYAGALASAVFSMRLMERLIQLMY